MKASPLSKENLFPTQRMTHGQGGKIGREISIDKTGRGGIQTRLTPNTKTNTPQR